MKATSYQGHKRTDVVYESVLEATRDDVLIKIAGADICGTVLAGKRAHATRSGDGAGVCEDHCWSCAGVCPLLADRGPRLCQPTPDVWNLSRLLRLSEPVRIGLRAFNLREVQLIDTQVHTVEDSQRAINLAARPDLGGVGLVTSTSQ